jgi:hypothetical protein
LGAISGDLFLHLDVIIWHDASGDLTNLSAVQRLRVTFYLKNFHGYKTVGSRRPLRHNTIGHCDRVTTDLKEYFELELAYRRAKDSYA